MFPNAVELSEAKWTEITGFAANALVAVQAKGQPVYMQLSDTEPTVGDVKGAVVVMPATHDGRSEPHPVTLTDTLWLLAGGPDCRCSVTLGS